MLAKAVFCSRKNEQKMTRDVLKTITDMVIAPIDAEAGMPRLESFSDSHFCRDPPPMCFAKKKGFRKKNPCQKVPDCDMDC